MTDAPTLPPFQRFLDGHAQPVLRFLVASIGPDDADDAFQETFLAALRAYGRLPPGSNLYAWVMTIAHRKAIDVARARARRPVPAGDAGAVAGGVAAPVAGGERDGDVWAAVRALPPRQREAVALRFAGDLAYADVARALRCSEEAARRAVHEGVKKLRGELA